MRWRVAPLLLLALCSTPGVLLGQPKNWEEIDAAVRDAVAAGDVPGAVVLVGQGERLVYRRAIGSRAVLPTPEPMTADTIFDLASLTKVVATTPSVLLLWEQGRLQLDAPLGRYIKDFAGPTFRDVT